MFFSTRMLQRPANSGLSDCLPLQGSNDAAQPTNVAAPHYHGHRQRLRARFLEAGSDALADYELIELVLFRAIPQRDVKPLAKVLIAKFGSFAEAVSARSNGFVWWGGSARRRSLSSRSCWRPPAGWHAAA